MDRSTSIATEIPSIRTMISSDHNSRGQDRHSNHGNLSTVYFIIVNLYTINEMYHILLVNYSYLLLLLL